MATDKLLDWLELDQGGADVACAVYFGSKRVAWIMILLHCCTLIRRLCVFLCVYVRACAPLHAYVREREQKTICVRGRLLSLLFLRRRTVRIADFLAQHKSKSALACSLRNSSWGVAAQWWNVDVVDATRRFDNHTFMDIFSRFELWFILKMYIRQINIFN